MKRLVNWAAAMILLALSVPMSAQIRDSIAVVHPVLSESGRNAYLEVARYFKGSRYTETVEFFEYLAKSEGFGSGFLVADEAGGALIVTNRHVVTFADSADIVFTLSTGEELKYEKCPVILKDNDIDIAVVRLPDGAAPTIARLEIASSPVADGIEIWAAGYPSLSKKPSWQFSKGTITNSRVVEEKMGPVDSAVFIQHTAPIAPGNSGGPLLVARQESASGYAVVGVNTWLVSGRQNTNFAIPASMVRSVLARASTAGADPGKNPEAVRTKAEAFSNSLTEKEFSRFTGDRFISDALGADKGWFLFKQFVDNTSNPAVSQEWQERFFSPASGDTMRQIVWYRLFKALQSAVAPTVLSVVESPTSRPDRFIARVEYRPAKGKGYYVDWGWEQGDWRILSTNAMGPSLVVK